MENNNSREFPVLITKHLTLRQLAENDVGEIFLLRSDANINRYLNRQPCRSLEEAAAFIQKIRSNKFLYWAITQTGHEKLVGTICLFDFSEELNKCEIGYELLPDFQGQGIMYEAVDQVIEFAMQSLGVKTIDAFTHKDNQSSTKLLLKSGFWKTESTEETNPDLVVFRRH